MSDKWRAYLADEITPELKNVFSVAKERTRGLLHTGILAQYPISAVIESAYVQGVMDGAQAESARRGKL